MRISPPALSMEFTAYAEACDGPYWRATKLALGDGRLKVVWVEDLLGKMIQKDELFDRFFSLIYVNHPSGLQQLIKDSTAHRSGSRYLVLQLPADIYATDFRMCDGLGACNDPAHIEVGLHAPSGGFLMGLLTTMRWPDHPACVVPYSGYSEEYGQIWKVCRGFCPSAVHVVWDEAVTKGNRRQGELKLLMAKSYREALDVSFRTALVHMPLAERDKWERTLSDSLAASAPPVNATVAATQRVTLIYEYGIREISIGALFFDTLNGATDTVPVSSIREWLDTVPIEADPIVRDARLLADIYWELRRSLASCKAYKQMLEVQNDVALPKKIAERDVFCFDRAKALGFEKAPPHYPSVFDWPYPEADKRRFHRLTFLFLLIQHHAETLRPLPRLSSVAGEMYEEMRTLPLENALNLDDLRTEFEKVFGLNVSVEPEINPFQSFEDGSRPKANIIKAQIPEYETWKTEYADASNENQRLDILKRLHKAIPTVGGDVLRSLVERAHKQVRRSEQWRALQERLNTRKKEFEGYFAELKNYIADNESLCRSDLRDHPPILPSTGPAIAQLLMPLPGTWALDLSLTYDHSWAIVLSKLWSDDNTRRRHYLDIVENDDGSCLSPADRLCAEQYAREKIGPRKQWPTWLQ